MSRNQLIIVLSVIAGFVFTGLDAQEELPKAERLAWFKDAKLGIFIHWGIYSVEGIDESWSFFNGYISHDDYMKQLDGFTAKKYDPKQWAHLIKKSGAKYAVITTKHHDGVALWDTKKNELNVVDKSKAKRDLITPFTRAIRNEDLKLGFYYSLLDWSHPDLYWFDGDWEQSAEQWKAIEIRNLVLTETPTAIINSRLQGYGDYATPEQGVPITKPESEYWELCMTMNNSWGYQPNDTEYKSVNQIIRIFVDCISMGGNLLLDIGPKPDGTIPEEQIAILEGLGRWTSKHEKAIYGTLAGIPRDYFNGYTALSKDSTILYLYVDNNPTGELLLKGIKNKVNRVWAVGNGTKLSHKVVGKQYWSSVPGLLYIEVPEEVQDEDVTVIAVLLDGKIDLYNDEVKPLESN